MGYCCDSNMFVNEAKFVVKFPKLLFRRRTVSWLSLVGCIVVNVYLKLIIILFYVHCVPFASKLNKTNFGKL